jgi:hypothetical protein
MSNRWVTNMPDFHREGLRILGPLIAAIRAERSTMEEEHLEKPVSCVYMSLIRFIA